MLPEESCCLISGISDQLRFLGGTAMEMSSMDGAPSNEPLSSGGPIGVKRRAAQFEQLVRLNKGREMIRMVSSLLLQSSFGY